MGGECAAGILPQPVYGYAHRAALRYLRGRGCIQMPGWFHYDPQGYLDPESNGIKNVTTVIVVTFLLLFQAPHGCSPFLEGQQPLHRV